MNAHVFDIGGTFLRAGVVKNAGAPTHIEKVAIDKIAPRREAQEVWDAIRSFMVMYVRDHESGAKEGDPVVIAFPGPIQDKATILDAPTLVGPLGRTSDLRSLLARDLSRPVHILNDVSAAAWYVSELVPASRFLVVTVSSGIGCKIFDHSHPLGVLDDVAYAGEIGHCVVDDSPDAPVCECGGKGHLGAISSGRGIEAAARKAAREDSGAFALSACARKFGATPETLSNESHIRPAAQLRDEWVLGVIRACTRPLARALLTVVLAAGVRQIIVIGGFGLSVGAPYLEVLREEIISCSRYRIMASLLPDLVALGQEGEEACLYGAAAYARRLGALP